MFWDLVEQQCCFFGNASSFCCVHVLHWGQPAAQLEQQRWPPWVLMAFLALPSIMKGEESNMKRMLGVPKYQLIWNCRFEPTYFIDMLHLVRCVGACWGCYVARERQMIERYEGWEGWKGEAGRGGDHVAHRCHWPQRRRHATMITSATATTQR